MTPTLDYLLLLIPVALSTVLWPINRKVMQNGGRGEVFGLWISATTAAITGVLSVIYHQSFASVSLVGAGLVVGFAFAIGFCVIINTCLKIGPTGPTAAANNMGLVGPVVLGLFWPRPTVLTAAAAGGLGLVALSLVGLGFGASGSSRQTVTRRWVSLVLVGWALAAVSMAGQYAGSVLNPDRPLAQVAAFYFFAMLFLLPFQFRRGRTWFLKIEFGYGLLIGVSQAVSSFLTLVILQRLSPKIVFPVTILSPLILILVLSAVVYKEKMGWKVWAACAGGILGLAVLTLTR